MLNGQKLTTAVWAYTRLEIPYLAQTVAEIALLVPLTLVLMPWARYWSPWVYFALLFGLMLLPFNLIRVLSLANTAVATQKLVLSGGLFLAVVVALHTLLYENYPLFSLGWLSLIASHVRTSGYPFWQQDVTVLLIVLFVWWRGTRLLSRSTSIYMVGLQLRLRLLVLAPIVALLAYWRLAWDISPFLALTVGASLLIVPLARAEEAAQAGGNEGLFVLTPRWLLVVGGVNTAVVFVSLWLAALPSQQQLFGPPQTALQLLVYTVLLTLVQLLAPLLITLLEFILFYLNLLLAPLAQLLGNLEFPLLAPLEEENLPPGAETIAQDNNSLLTFLPILLFGLFFLLLAFLIIYAAQRAVRRTHVQRRARTRPIQFSLGDEEADGGSLWDKLRGAVPAWRAWRMAASIRRIYAQMVAIASDEGYPRGDTETPYEYLHQLHQLWPNITAETELITQAYVRVRYGELPETRAELEAIFAAWEQVIAQVSDE